MKALVPIVILVLIGGGLWYLFSRPENLANPSFDGTLATSSDATGAGTSTNPSAASDSDQQADTIVYSDTGFSPRSLTVPAGTTVTFRNQSSQDMMVGSAPHPTHEGYDGTTRAVHCATGYTGPAPFDECIAAGPGASWAFTFTKAGTWAFHNHVGPTHFGRVIVQ